MDGYLWWYKLFISQNISNCQLKLMTHTKLIILFFFVHIPFATFSCNMLGSLPYQHKNSLYTRRIKKLNKFETALKFAKRPKVRKFWLIYRLVRYLWCRINEKNCEFQMFKTQGEGGAYFEIDLKWLAHEIWMLKSNSELVGRKFVKCFIVNFKNVAWVWGF